MKKANMRPESGETGKIPTKTEEIWKKPARVVTNLLDSPNGFLVRQYQKNLERICSPDDNPKINALEHLLEHVWPPADKVVFMCAK